MVHLWMYSSPYGSMASIDAEEILIFKINEMNPRAEYKNKQNPAKTPVRARRCVCDKLLAETDPCSYRFYIMCIKLKLIQHQTKK